MREFVVEILNRLIDSETIEARSYSGRGMYGKKCLAITCENPVAGMYYLTLSLIEEIGDDTEDVQNILKELGEPTYDSMGLEYVLYFPDFEWED